MSEEKKPRGGAHVAGRRTAAPRAEKKAAAQEAAPRPRKKKSQTSKAPLIAVLAALAVVIGLGAYTVSGVLGRDIRSGVHMGEVDLSGMNRSEANAALEEAYGSAFLNEQLEIRVGESGFTLTAADAGLSYDIPASVETAYAYGQQGRFSQRLKDFWKAKLGGVQLELTTSLNEDMLKKQIEGMREAVAQPLAQSSYSYDNGVLTLDKGQRGFALDDADLLSQMETALRTAVFEPIQAKLIQADPAPLDIAAILSEVAVEPTETYLDLEADPSGKTIHEGTPGVIVDEAAVKSAVASPDRVTTVQCQLIAPKYTVSEYKALLFRDLLSEGTTTFNAGNKGRTTNVLLATDFCNGVILMPGDVFSYNSTVGPRTYERGFKDATIYVGTSAEDGVGGGICQVSSTIYYAALRADLKIVERSAHSRMVTYVPLGEDATVAWGSKDFRFENNTDFPIKIVTSHASSSLTVKLYGTKTQNKTVKIETTQLSKTPFETIRKLDTSLPAGTQKVESNGYTGYETESYRVVYIDGKQVSRTFENKSVYKKYDKVVLYNDAAPAVTPTEPVTPPPTPVTPPDSGDVPMDPSMETDPIVPIPLP